MEIKQLLKSKRQDILALAAKHGASNVRVFGSVARGETTEHSDVDFLVEFSPERTLLDQIGLRQDLENLLNCQVDVAESEGLHELMRPRVLKEAVPL